MKRLWVSEGIREEFWVLSLPLNPNCRQKTSKLTLPN